MAWYRIEVEIDEGSRRGEELFYYLEEQIKATLPVKNIRTTAVSLLDEGLVELPIRCPNCGELIEEGGRT